jgi:hypothetical protein
VSWKRTDLVQVLTAIQARIVSQTSLTSDTCLIAFDGEEPPLNPATSTGMYARVYPEGEDFDQPKMDGGGTLQVEQVARVVVQIHTTQQLDQTGHAKEALMNATRGVLPLVKSVLKALSIHDLIDSTDQILLEPMRPLSMGFNPVDGTCSISFECRFFWDLS